MTSFRRLSYAATVATFLQIAIGGLVRATKSGLGCGDDWPACGGRLVPELASRAEIIEFTHRAMATLVIVLVGAVALSAYRSLRDRPRLLWPAVAAFGLVIFQAALGAIVVVLHLDAASVVLHLGTALALGALLVYLSAAATAPSSPPTTLHYLVGQTRLAAVSVFALLLVGSYVTGRDAGYVFPDWPLMDGRLLPNLGPELHGIHFAHRLLAVAVGAVILIVAVRVMRHKNDAPMLAGLARGAVGLFALEIALGALNVWTRLNAAVVTLHLAVGALIWGLLVALALLTQPHFLERAIQVSSVGRRIALESGR